jgi:hypothetical protein
MPVPPAIHESQRKGRKGLAMGAMEKCQRAFGALKVSFAAIAHPLRPLR